MKRIALSILAAATVTAAIPAVASAQPQRPIPYDQYRPSTPPRPPVWQTINQRQAELDRRIDIGVRMGRITRREATALRTEFRRIATLERSYRRGGLTIRERAELDRQFDRLSARIRVESTDRDNNRPGDNRPGQGNGPGYGNGPGNGNGPRR